MTAPRVARVSAIIGILAVTLAGCADSGIPRKGEAAAARTLPARYWEWLSSTARGKDPVSDTTGKFCDVNQPTDVFFLAGSSGETSVTRTCAVTARTPVYFPLINELCQKSPRESDDQAIDECKLRVHGEATLDGRRLDARVQTSGGSFHLKSRKGNDLGLGSLRGAVVWGVWVGPLLLTAGQHTLKIHAVAEGFEKRLTYKLTTIR